MPSSGVNTVADRVVVRDARLDRLRTLSRWLDSRIRIPGTPIRFGLDAIMDIVPVLGDVAGVGFSSSLICHMVPTGGAGSNRSFQPISLGVWSPLTLLQRRQAATRFSQESAPPRDFGWTWSMVWAALPQ